MAMGLRRLAWGTSAYGLDCKWLGEEASLQLVVLKGLEKVLAEEQIFQVEAWMINSQFHL